MGVGSGALPALLAPSKMVALQTSCGRKKPPLIQSVGAWDPENLHFATFESVIRNFGSLVVSKLLLA